MPEGCRKTYRPTGEAARIARGSSLWLHFPLTALLVYYASAGGPCSKLGIDESMQSQGNALAVYIFIEGLNQDGSSKLEP